MLLDDEILGYKLLDVNVILTNVSLMQKGKQPICHKDLWGFHDCGRTSICFYWTELHLSD